MLTPTEFSHMYVILVVAKAKTIMSNVIVKSQQNGTMAAIQVMKSSLQIKLQILNIYICQGDHVYIHMKLNISYLVVRNTLLFGIINLPIQ